MGSIAAHAGEKTSAMTEFATHLGLAFQIADDVLDVTATPEQLGKKTNKDAGRGKNTYPQLMGIEASRAAAQKHVASAVAALEGLGASADGLRAIARFVTARAS
jgi:geranylgeranyl pyrophosphate synthase